METNLNSESLLDSLEVGSITLVSIQTPLLTNTKTMTAVANEVRRIARQNSSPNILLDFHLVEHLSIDFVSEMKAVADDIQMRGGTVRCCSLRRDTRALVGLLGLDTLYVGRTVPHALARYESSLKKQRELTTNAAT